MSRMATAYRHPSRSNPNPTGVPQGTPGGATASSRAPGARNIMAGDEIYLWILVLIEAFIVGIFRSRFRRYHGG